MKLERLYSYTGSPLFQGPIEPGNRFGVLGTGPGGIDCARYLVSYFNAQYPIDLFSRLGLLSKVQTIDPPDRSFDPVIEQIVQRFEREKPITLAQAIEAFHPVFKTADNDFNFTTVTRPPTSALATLKEDIRQARSNGPAYRHVLESIGSRFSRIWRCLHPTQKTIFRRFQRLYYVFRHAMPIETAEWLAANMEDQKIRIGRVQPPVESQGSGLVARVEFQPDRVEHVTYSSLINATGPDYDVNRSTLPLVQQLLRDGMARADPLGGFVTIDFELEASPNVFAMGALLRGEDFAVHSVPALARHAKVIEATIRDRFIAS